MWPGDQQPGGEQNPQQPNPYQQPGQPGHPQSGAGQQPNPYQQPGYGYPQQPGPYPQQPPQQPGYGYPQQPGGYPQQPGQPPQGGPSDKQPYPPQPYGQQQWGAPGQPGAPQPPQGGGGRKKAVIAGVTAVAVVAAAVAGFLLLQDDGDDKETAGGDKRPSGSPTAEEPSAEPTPEESDDPTDPVVPGWQTVVNPKHFSAFDVPRTPDWELASTGTITGFEDEDGKLLVAMSAPAYYKQDWCKDSNRAVVGTKGAQGSKNTKEAAEIAASNFVLAGYDQKQKGTLKESGGKPFKNAHGIKGHTAVATLTGGPKDSKCDPGAAKAVTVSWINANDDLAIWIMLTDAGVDDELPDATVKKMMNSLRSSGEPGEAGDPRG
ncbi:hypothetical protein [Streptomyces sp. NPDC054784]